MLFIIFILSLLASKTNALEQKIIDFGKANNRRVVYILELVDENGNPLDPRIASSGFNPVDADSDGSGIVAANGDSFLTFGAAFDLYMPVRGQ